jgi:hypothetical protein
MATPYNGTERGAPYFFHGHSKALPTRKLQDWRKSAHAAAGADDEESAFDFHNNKNNRQV